MREGIMIKEYVAEAETVEEALEIALNELGVGVEDVDYVILEEPVKKRFGFGSSRNAKVSVTVREEKAASMDGESGSPQQVSTAGAAAVRSDGMGATTAPNPSSNHRELVDLTSLSDEEIDKIADTAISVVTKLAEMTGATEFEVEEFEGEEGEIILDLVGGDLSFLIGRHGRTLDALQTATSAIVTKSCGVRYPLSIDIEGYRHRRKQKVREIAQSAAERALRHGNPVALRPMSPQERRLVHVAIRDIQGVASTSEGSGEARHVVILVTND